MRTAIGVIRGWVIWNATNGATVEWGSKDPLQFNRVLTVEDFENIATEIYKAVELRYESRIKELQQKCLRLQIEMRYMRGETE